MPAVSLIRRHFIAALPRHDFRRFAMPRRFHLFARLLSYFRRYAAAAFLSPPFFTISRRRFAADDASCFSPLLSIFLLLLIFVLPLSFISSHAAFRCRC
jgi:hypothetical protein